MSLESIWHAFVRGDGLYARLLVRGVGRAEGLFSHASEDKPIVDRLFRLVGERHPDIQGWLDIYEIAGGEVLIDKITEASRAPTSS